MPLTLQRRENAVRKSRNCIVAFVACAVVVQAVLIGAENTWPEMRDVQYAYKLKQLRAQISANPERPLVLLLGSSRTLCGLRPDLMAERKTSASPLLFNFGASGSGPIKEGIYLRRLLDEGIKPDAVLIEVMPVFLRQDAVSGEECWLSANQFDLLTSREIERTGALLRDKEEFRRQWRDALFTHSYAWRWLLERKHMRRSDAGGWMPWKSGEVSAEERAAQLEVVRQGYQFALTDFQVTAAADRSMRNLLDLCRDNGISFSLYLMPEGSQFRSWYSPEDRAEIDNYLAKLSREYGCQVFDATCWAADEHFIDNHHLLQDGAEAVSRCFGEQAFGPFLVEMERREKASQVLAAGANAIR